MYDLKVARFYYIMIFCSTQLLCENKLCKGKEAFKMQEDVLTLNFWYIVLTLIFRIFKTD